jgi:hypothetical protein
MKDKLSEYGVLVGEEHQQVRREHTMKDMLLDYGVLVGEEHQQGRSEGTPTIAGRRLLGQ